jgi:hypothetical protein
MKFMSKWRILSKQPGAISAVLIVALVFLTLLPAHIHLHHAEQAADHESHSSRHVVDLHMYGVVEDHSHHGEAHVVKTSPDGLITKFDKKFTPIFYLGLFLTFFMLVLPKAGFNRLKQTISLKRYSYFHSPPLRGPPH